MSEHEMYPIVTFFINGFSIFHGFSFSTQYIKMRIAPALISISIDFTLNLQWFLFTEMARTVSNDESKNHTKLKAGVA